MPVQNRTRRGWVIPAAVASAAVVASLAVGTLGAYTATINGDNNLAGTGTLTMSESLVGAGGELTETIDTAMAEDGTNVIASEINRYGGNMAMVPGEEVVTTVQIKNTGGVDGTLSLSVGEAVSTMQGEGEVLPEGGQELATALRVSLTAADEGEIFEGTLASFQDEEHLVGATPITLGPEDTQDFIFTITFPEGESGADLMGQQVQQGLTWTLTSTGAENEEVAE